MSFTTILTYVACICFIFIIGKLFIVPIKIIFKIILNSILGGCIIFLINFFTSSFGFHIGLNLITSIFVGLLGVPRCYYTNTFSIIFSISLNIFILQFYNFILFNIGINRVILSLFILQLQILPNFLVYQHLNFFLLQHNMKLFAMELSPI